MDEIQNGVSTEVYDVAIVGAGPVGCALGILLGQRGRRVVVLERWLEPYPLPRAVHYDHEIGRILQACGLGQALAAISEPAEVYEWRNADGATLLRFGRVGHGASGWPESSMFNQPALEALLAERLGALPSVEVRRGIEVVGLADPGAGAPVALACRTSGEATEHTVTARYVVGCDGANSIVRTLVDAPVRDLGFFYDWLIVDVVLDEPRPFDPINLQICDPVRPTTAVSGGPGRRRWEFMRLPHESMDDLNDEATAWRLLAPWDVTPANATMERHAVYTFQARWAERWRAGSVFLAGDAAHLMPPFAGQGMCSGLRDAANLAWKLDLVLDDRADDSLLDTYETERMPNVEAVINFSMELGKVICVPDPDEAAARDVAMRAGVVDGQVSEVPPLPAIDAGLLTATPAAGSLFLQAAVAAAAGSAPGRCDDVIGSGWTLLIAGDAPAGALVLDPQLQAWFEVIGGRVVTIGGPAADLHDVDGAYGAWFERHGALAVLQRPDFHVYGSVAAAAADLGAAVDALVRQLRDDVHASCSPLLPTPTEVLHG
jgi:2-polyprenyl-6-methoxyphenol hydroxylase-like FAD-dependent oxidoreductase